MSSDPPSIRKKCVLRHESRPLCSNEARDVVAREIIGHETAQRFPGPIPISTQPRCEGRLINSRCDHRVTPMSEPSKRCANCNTERYGIYCKGYCYRCYLLVVQKRQVERWDVKNPSTLKGFPRSFPSFSQRYLEERASEN